MNYGIIFRLIGVIFGTLFGCFALSAGVGWFMRGEALQPFNLEGWVISLALSGGLAAICLWMGRGHHKKLFRREAMAVIGLGWLGAALVGAVPYVIFLPNISVADAFFESTSGLTTTGASVLDHLETIPPGLMFWRCISQWIGGLGVVVFFVALLASLGAGAKMLYSNESSAHATELEATRVQAGVLRIFLLYGALSVACAVAYHLGGMGWYDAIIHMFTTLSTGGFSRYGASMAYFQSPLLEWLCVLFMLLSGTSFLAMIRLCRCRREDWLRMSEVYAYYAIALGSTLVIALFLLETDGHISHWSEALRDSAFQVSSIMTTTGFVTQDYQLWLPVTHIILLMLMVAGGCSGSTAGGVKVVRLVAAWKICLRQIERSFRSRIVRPIKLNGRTMDESALEQTTVFLVLAGGICVLCLPILAILEPQMSAAGTISALFACLFNVGPGLNEVGPTQNYAFMNDAAKTLLGILMILGRLEFYALFALCLPSMWKRFS